VPSLFISDLHLTEERPEANERFIELLEGKARGSDALYILGDFFEHWIGDDDLEASFNAVVAGLLADLARRGVPVYLMHGNRDFLIGERFCAATGAKLLADPSVHEIQGVRTLLMHGDTLCTDDVDYQNWRRIARSEAWQREFLSKSLPERRRAIVGMREQGKEAVRAKPAEIMDVNDAAVAEAMRAHAVTRLVHGHTHRPGRHALTIDGRPAERWVLPDWYGRGGYLEIGRGAPKLVRF
jgi:UDP-2,3-diacylglucosamine hydrolase